MDASTRVLRVNTVELLRQRGNRRVVDTVLDPADLEVVDERITGPVDVHLALESTLDGIEVTGTISVPWADVCRRCLRTVAGVATVDVRELYQERVVDPDAFEIEGVQLDLKPMVRELVLLELPDAPLCRDDCAGICPTCGADRNESPCDCVTIESDDRWAALDDLRLAQDEHASEPAPDERE
jgi:uncharacterized protein